MITPILLGIAYDPSALALKETVAGNKSTGRKSFVYINLNEKISSVGSRVDAAPEYGSITDGWILKNDGCWYHGKLVDRLQIEYPCSLRMPIH